MAHSKIGFHVAANCGGCGGIEAYWDKLNKAGIPFVAYSANDAGIIQQAATHEHAELIYRDVKASTVDPADYDWDPSQAAIAYWEATKLALPTSIREWKYRCWIELLNEPGKEGDQANWVGWLMFHMAAQAIADGYKVMGPGWSAGTPEPEHWKLPGWKAYLTLCAAYPDKAAVSLHEYSLDNDIHHLEPWLVGRYEFLLLACDEMGIAYPKIFITECGWTLNSMPADEQAKADIAFLAGLYAKEYAIQGANLWTLQSGAGNGNLPARLNGLMGWLTDFTLTTTFPEPDKPDPPEEPPGDEMENLLVNGSFEGEWADATAFPGHIPQGWEVEYLYGAAYPNPFGQPYKNGEAVKKHRGMLPAEEQSVFVWDGEWTYKIFGGGTKSFWFVMRQTVNLPADWYELAVPVWVDHYHWKGFKDYNVDPLQAQARVVVNGGEVDGFVSLPSGGRREYVAKWQHPGGPAAIEIHLRSNWDINGNFWLDGLSLAAVEDEPPPPPPPPPAKHKAIVVKLPQDGTAEEWRAAADYAFPSRHTLTASHDDMLTILHGGNADSYVKLAWPERQPDVGALITAEGYSWEPIFYEPPASFAFEGWPAEGARTITQAFGARPEVYQPLGFPGHEGVDLPATLGTPVRAVAAGTVSKLTTTGNYGNRIDIKHAGGWITTYAHLASFAGLAVGAKVAAGTVLGYAGSTGNSTGVHVHLGLKREGYAFKDAQGVTWPFNIFDPTPFLEKFLPAVEMIDLLPYLKGDGRAYMVRHPDGSQEKFRAVDRGNGRWLILKNGQWEELWLSGDFIWRGKDTSAGEGNYYRQFEASLEGARWSPRLMRVGQVWTSPAPHTVQTYRKGDCAKVAHHRNGQATNKVTLLARHASKAWNGVTVPDVIELRTHTGELMWFGRGYGLVAWESGWGQSAIAHNLPANEADNQPEQGCFGP